MAVLDLTNIITVTLLSALRGLADINTSIIGMFTTETPLLSGYGDYQLYKSPSAVAEDWGTDSDAYRLAVKIFAQSPNILTGRGYLAIIPLNGSAAAAPATVLSSRAVDLTKLTATNYTLRVAINGAGAEDFLIGEIDLTSLETAEASLNAYDLEDAGLSFVLSGELTAANIKLVTTLTGVGTSIVISDATSGTDIAPKLAIADASATGADSGTERVKDAILRTYQSITYFGVILNQKLADAALLELANTMQTMDKLLFVGSNLSADITGIFKTIKDAALTHTRCLYYSLSEDDALDFAAGYAGRGLSINFAGFLTAHSMHLKEIVGLVADSGLTQTLVTSAKNNGVDIYGDFGIPKVYTSGANQFFDQVYTRLAFKLRIQVAGFNVLAETNTKIPQTEDGMNKLKSAYRKVCEQFITNGVFNPGKWNSSTTFGNPEDHIRNIADVGYFIYSDPIGDQSQADREARIAPPIYIAAKDAGAIHSSDVIVYVEA